MSDRLEEIKNILNSPGEVFFGSVSKNGEVSQDVVDAEPYFNYLIERTEGAERQKEYFRRIMIEQMIPERDILRRQNKRYREALEQIIKDECNMGRKGMWAEKEARHALEDVDNGK